MSESVKPTYVGKVKKIETNYGEITKVGIHKKDIETLQNSLNELDWVNLIIKSKDGKSWMQIDNYKPRQ